MNTPEDGPLGITGTAIERYIEEISGPSPAPLDEMEARAEREAFPVIGPQVGRFLALLTAATGAERILELGSGFGYSAIWFARGLAAAGGQDAGAAPGDNPRPPIHCTDTSTERRDDALSYFARAGVSGLMQFHVVDGLDYARELAAGSGSGGKPADGPPTDGPPPFDIIFNDVDKHAYPEVPGLAAKLLRPGGLLITDNTLWYGLVADPAATDTDTEGVRAYNRIVTSTDEWESSIVPIRDGITISRKT